jgi:hypothetical protein
LRRRVDLGVILFPYNTFRQYRDAPTEYR